MIKNTKLGKEIVVVADNRAGTLSKVAKILADRGIDIVAISAQGAGGVGLMNFVVDDHLRAKDTLARKKVPFHENSVLLLEVEDKPGVLLCITRKIAAKRIDVLNIYGSAPSAYDRCLLVLSTVNNQKALVALKTGK